MPASIKHLTDKKLNLTSLLARWKDGLYYKAAIVKCDKNNKKCLVCFEDGSEVWVMNRDVHIQLSLDQLNEDEDIVCCICDDGNSETPNEIILCDVCQQGYHQKCHNPPVDSSKIDESEDSSEHKDWFCATCSYILNQSDRAKLSASAQKQQQQPQKNPQTSSSSSQSQSKQAQPQQQQTQPKPKSQSPATPPQLQSQPHVIQKQAPTAVAKVKQTPASQQQKAKTTVGPIKPTVVAPVQKPAPYYPLSSQVRVASTSSTAALASMTASSALVVGSSAGRTKQDLVNQSNRSSQRHQRSTGAANNVEVVVSPPVKHAVRKSSVNFMPPVRQSALPTATRSAPVPSITPPPAKVPHLIATTITPVVVATPATTVATTTNLSRPSITTPQPSSTIAIDQPITQHTTTISSKNNSNNKSPDKQPLPVALQPTISIVSKLVSWTPDTQASQIKSPIVTTASATIATTTKASGESGDIVKEPSQQASSNKSSNHSGKSIIIKEKASSNSTISNNSSASPSGPTNNTDRGSNNSQPTVIVTADSSLVVRPKPMC